MRSGRERCCEGTPQLRRLLLLPVRLPRLLPPTLASKSGVGPPGEMALRVRASDALVVVVPSRLASPQRGRARLPRLRVADTARATLVRCCLCHACSASIACRMRATPRPMREVTVPCGAPTISATSFRLKPRTWCNTTASRCSRGSAATTSSSPLTSGRRGASGSSSRLANPRRRSARRRSRARLTAILAIHGAKGLLRSKPDIARIALTKASCAASSARSCRPVTA